MAQAEKKNVKKVIIGVIVLVVLLAAALIAYFALKPKTDAGTKTIGITVVDDQKTEKSYTFYSNYPDAKKEMPDTIIRHLSCLFFSKA